MISLCRDHIPDSVRYSDCDMQAEAKDAFKELLASVNTLSEWTWEQAMRLIVNDPRCGLCWSCLAWHLVFTDLHQDLRVARWLQLWLFNKSTLARQTSALVLVCSCAPATCMNSQTGVSCFVCSYGALKSLGEKKQCFNEYIQVGQSACQSFEILGHSLASMRYLSAFKMV